MKRIVILGSSPAGVKIIEEIRTSGLTDEITLIAFDGHYPYQRDAFACMIAKDIAPEQVFCKAKDFYTQNNVNVILDRKILRINVKRRIIFMEDKEQIAYDTLVVTDTPENKFPNIKGANKTGVYGYKKLKDIDQIFGVIPLIDTVVIQSDSFTGLQAAVALVKRGKEVLLISSQKGFLSTHFPDEVAQWLVSRFEDSKLRIIGNNAIDEILGDKDAKAVRLKEGKVYSAPVIIFGESSEDLRLFADSGLQMNTIIEVDDQYRTNINSIFAIDQVSIANNSEPVTPPSVLQAQGITVSAAINDQQRSIDIPTATLSLDIEGLVITVLGQTQLAVDIEVRTTFDQEANSYKGMHLEGDRLVGAVLVNAQSEKDEILRLIIEKECVEGASAEQIGE